MVKHVSVVSPGLLVGGLTCVPAQSDSESSLLVKRVVNYVSVVCAGLLVGGLTCVPARSGSESPGPVDGLDSSGSYDSDPDSNSKGALTPCLTPCWTRDSADCRLGLAGPRGLLTLILTRNSTCRDFDRWIFMLHVVL